MANGISLHIGVNELDPGHYGGKYSLKACEADATDMQLIAKASGFGNDILLTKKATRGAVISGIKGAAAALSGGDIFFLSYAGHGSQVPDTNGDEPDGRDETWCLYDGMLIDDELKALWKLFKPGVRILLLSDSCHSGTVSRAPIWMAPDAPLARYLDEEVSFRAFRTNRAFYDDVMKKLKELIQQAAKAAKDAAKAGSADTSVLLMSGCQDNQTSQDGAHNGRFTGTLLSVWNEGQFKGDYGSLHSRIVSRMPPDQTPNLDKQGASIASFVAQRPFTI
ncbi:caspase family protein [Candidatus Bipolaricaulota bacterium]|nr:caspase family protein [Candidatus Bipolaricaulota bacterium]